MSGLKGADNKITQQINTKLSSRGIRTPCNVSVRTVGGDVTLSGTVQFSHQKIAAMKTANTIAGVRRVIDQLTVKAPQRC